MGGASARPRIGIVPRSVSNWVSSRWRRRWCCGRGWPFFVRGWASLVNRNLNMFTLIAHGHRRGLALQRRRDRRCRGCSRRASATRDGAVAVYFEAAAVITVLVLLGQVLELRARERTGGAIRALLDLAPKTARAHRATTAATRRSARPRSRSATGCACGPARRCRSTATVRRGPQRDRRVAWSPASRCRSSKAPGDQVIGGTLNGTGALRHARREGRPRHHARAHRRRWWPRRSAAARRSSAWPTGSPAGSCPRCIAVAVARLRRLGALGTRAARSPMRWSPRSRC